MTEEERVTSVKEAAGRRAADLVETGTIVGLGTGSTVWFTLVRLAERIKTEGLEIVGVPTSMDTTTKATELGIPVVGLGEVEKIHLTIDGADEIAGKTGMAVFARRLQFALGAAAHVLDIGKRAKELVLQRVTFRDNGLEHIVAVGRTSATIRRIAVTR